jgi:hypothetical protein
MPFPSEIFTTIAEFLAGEYKLGSLSSLNLTCRLIRESTNAVLWTTVTFDAITPNWNPMMEELLQQDIPLRPTPAQRESLQSIRTTFTGRVAESGFLPATRIYAK